MYTCLQGVKSITKCPCGEPLLYQPNPLSPCTPPTLGGIALRFLICSRRQLYFSIKRPRENGSGKVISKDMSSVLENMGTWTWIQMQIESSALNALLQGARQRETLNNSSSRQLSFGVLGGYDSVVLGRVIAEIWEHELRSWMGPSCKLESECT